MAGRYDQKKNNKQGADQEQDQEQEVVQDQQLESETSRSQSQMGNQAMAAMLAGRADGAPGEGGGGGGGHSTRKRKNAEKEGQDYGGDDDAIDEGHLTLEDLTRSWNPGIKKSEDRPRFVEPMPDDDLPPEDPEFLDDVYGQPHSGKLPPIRGIDALLQPSSSVVAASMASWVRATTRWSDQSPCWRSLGYMIRAGAPVLQSRDARVLPSRSAIGSLASALLASSPAVQQHPSIETGALIEFCLELEGRVHKVENVVGSLEGQATRLPRAVPLLKERLQSTRGTVRPSSPPAATATALIISLSQLSRFENLERALPPLNDLPPEEPDEDDPLGLDAILNAETGGAPDREAGLYQAAVQAAEKMASAASMTRIRWVAVALLVDEVTNLWSTTPASTLLTLAKRLDTEIDQVLRLLLEVARAAQKRTVPPKGLRNGLRRAARKLDRLRKTLVKLLVQLVSAVLPGSTQAGMSDRVAPDALTYAFEVGEPKDCLPWVRRQPNSVDTLATWCFVQSCCEAPFQEQATLYLQLRDRCLQEQHGPLATVATICLAHALLRLNDFSGVHALGRELQAVGRTRRNGLLVVEGAMLQMEAHVAVNDVSRAQQVRVEAGRLAWDLNARGALTLLARWTPSTEESDTYSAFFQVPGTEVPEA